MTLVREKRFLNLLTTHSFWRVCLLFVCAGMCWGKPLAVNAQSSSSLSVTLQDNKVSSSKKDIIFAPKPGQTYEFEAKVVNHRDEVVEMQAFTSQAISKDKTISYEEGESDQLINKSYQLAQYVELSMDQKKLSDSVVLKAHEEKKLQVKIKIPQSFQGEMLGGINVVQSFKTAQQKEAVKTEQVYQQVIVVRLKGDEISELEPQTYSNFQFINRGEKLRFNYENTNPNGKLIYADEGTYQLQNPKQEVIAQGSLDHQVVLTPYTKTPFYLPLKNQELISGKYTFTTTIHGEKKTYTFSYSESELKALARTNETMRQKQAASDQKLLILCLSIVVALLIIVLGVVLIKNRKKQHNS